MALEFTAEQQKWLTRRQWATLWGQRHMIQPYLLETIFGDGMQLVAITPLNTRPNYYLVRVDSKWWMASTYRLHEHHDGENHIAEHIDDICEGIEDETGRKWQEDDDGKEYLAEWPALDDDSGVSWATAMDLYELVNKKFPK